jgi:hypothetical protein
VRILETKEENRMRNKGLAIVAGLTFLAVLAGCGPQITAETTVSADGSVSRVIDYVAAEQFESEQEAAESPVLRAMGAPEGGKWSKVSIAEESSAGAEPLVGAMLGILAMGMGETYKYSLKQSATLPMQETADIRCTWEGDATVPAFTISNKAKISREDIGGGKIRFTYFNEISTKGLSEAMNAVTAEALAEVLEPDLPEGGREESMRKLQAALLKEGITEQMKQLNPMMMTSLPQMLAQAIEPILKQAMTAEQAKETLMRFRKRLMRPSSFMRIFLSMSENLEKLNMLPALTYADNVRLPGKITKLEGGSENKDGTVRFTYSAQTSSSALGEPGMMDKAARQQKATDIVIWKAESVYDPKSAKSAALKRPNTTKKKGGGAKLL